MAIGLSGTVGTAQNKDSDDELVLTVAAAHASVGRCAIAHLAFDHPGLSSSPNATTFSTSCVDSKGNTWVKISEWSAGGSNPGTPGAWVTTARWICKNIAATLTTEDTITFGFTQAVVAKSAVVVAYSVPLEVVEVDTSGGTSTWASLEIDDLPSKEYLVERGGCTEGNAVGHESFTPSSGWTKGQNSGTTGGSAGTNVVNVFEWIIGTATSFTSAPTFTTADNATIMAVYEEVTGEPPEISAAISITEAGDVLDVEAVVVDTGITEAVLSVVEAGDGLAMTAEGPSAPYGPDRFWKPPTAVAGWDGTPAHTMIDEWPPVTGGSPDQVNRQHSSLGSSQAWIGFGDCSTLGGEPTEGWRLWMECFVDTTSPGYSITAHLFANGISGGGLPVASAAPVTVNWGTTQRQNNLIVIDFDVSSLPVMTNMAVRLDLQNLAAGSNRIRVNAVRLSKSPFMDLQKAQVPPGFTADEVLGVWRASDLLALGAPNGAEVYVLPDATGRGAHAVFTWTGTPQINSAGFIEAAGQRLIARIRNRHMGDFAIAIRASTTTMTGVQMIISTPGNFVGTSITDKNIHVVPDSDRGIGSVTIMSGDGSQPSHLNSGAGAVTAGVVYLLTQHIREAGTDRVWRNIETGTIINANSGSNNFSGMSLFNREDDGRGYTGNFYEMWVVSMDDHSDADLQAFREWLFSGGTPLPIAAAVGITEAGDALAMTGAVVGPTPDPVAASIGITEAGDTLSLTAAVAAPADVVAASINIVELADTLSIAAESVVIVEAAINITESPDVLALPVQRTVISQEEFVSRVEVTLNTATVTTNRGGSDAGAN